MTEIHINTNAVRNVELFWMEPSQRIVNLDLGLWKLSETWLRIGNCEPESP